MYSLCIVYIGAWRWMMQPLIASFMRSVDNMLTKTMHGSSKTTYCGEGSFFKPFQIRQMKLVRIIGISANFVSIKFNDWCVKNQRRNHSRGRSLMDRTALWSKKWMWAITVRRPLKRQTARKKSNAARSQTQGHWLKLPALCHWAMTITSKHPSQRSMDSDSPDLVLGP